jgi:branched-chain amino acid transport system substrate-binding protein
MKKLLLASAATLGVASAAVAGGHGNEVKLGIALGFSGPLDSLAPPMEAGGKFAIEKINETGLFLDGATVTSVSGDSTCVDAGAATAVAERMITSDGINGLIGAMCSGATGAIVSNVSVPNGMVQISPSATSPALSTIEDNGLFFRMTPSDARQGVVMTEIIMEAGIKEVALTYTNNDYGKGLADSFASAFEAAGGTITINAPHDEAKGDYSAEIGALASAGGEALVVAGYADGGGAGVIQAALDTGSFETFVLPDGMISDTLTAAFGSDLDGSFGQIPAPAGDGAAVYVEMVGDAFDPTSAYAGESFDAAAVMLLAMQAAGSSAPADYLPKILEVANAPGEPIGPGDLAKALQILKDGGDIDYSGATGVELIGPGESGGTYRQVLVEGGEFKTITIR